jgi:hypothetical protein
MGGGAAGTTHPTGPIVNTSSLNAISFGTGINSGINVLSGGGNIEIRGTSNANGVSLWSGFTLKATTGSITLEGTSSGTAQGVRIAASGTSTIESAKTNGDAITIIGNNTSNSVVPNTNGIGIGYAATQVNISATGGGDVRLQGTVTNQGNVATYFNNTNVSPTGGDILVSGDYAELNSTKFDASAGGAVQIKSSHHIGILTSTIETSGPSSGSGGQTWDGQAGGHEHRVRTRGRTNGDATPHQGSRGCAPQGPECSGIGPFHKRMTPSLVETSVLLRPKPARGNSKATANRVRCYRGTPG